VAPAPVRTGSPEATVHWVPAELEAAAAITAIAPVAPAAAEAVAIMAVVVAAASEAQVAPVLAVAAVAAHPTSSGAPLRPTCGVAGNATGRSSKAMGS
jgi:hypothetical protein